MLHIWLIPVVIVLALVLAGFYLVVKACGGSGVRSEGKTLYDDPAKEPPPEE